MILSILTSEFSLAPCRVKKQILLLADEISLLAPAPSFEEGRTNDQPGTGVECGCWGSGPPLGTPPCPSPPPARVAVSACVARAAGRRTVSGRLASRVVSLLELTGGSQSPPRRGVLPRAHRHLSSAGGARGQPETEPGREKWPDPGEARE